LLKFDGGQDRSLGKLPLGARLAIMLGLAVLAWMAVIAGVALFWLL
jgi:hypothetical protein